MQLVRIILIYWRNGVEGRWKREKVSEKKQTLVAARGHEPHLKQGLEPLPCPTYSCTGVLRSRDSAVAGTGWCQEKCCYKKLLNIRRTYKKVFNTMDKRDTLLFLLVWSSPGPKFWDVTEKGANTSFSPFSTKKNKMLTYVPRTTRDYLGPSVSWWSMGVRDHEKNAIFPTLCGSSAMNICFYTIQLLRSWIISH